MRILVVGGGGREHALVWKLAQSPQAEALFCAPGNAGIAALATCVPIAPGDVDGLVRFAERERIDLTVVGPELPLTLGLVDRFAARGLRAFGPTAAAARLEGSKVFAKELLSRLGVPTAAFAVFDDPDAAARHVRARGAPVVVKADGLASGKGVFVCATVAEALAAIDAVMRRRAFGEAGARIVVEDCLVGEELSFMAITDGTTVLPLAPAQDHKRALDGDRGPNTGGMGAYSPAPVATSALEAAVMREVMEPVVRGLTAAGVRYTGVLYAGLMVHEGRAQVLEFNVRFGDPEAQVLLVRLRRPARRGGDRLGSARRGLRRARRRGLSRRGHGRAGDRRPRAARRLARRRGLPCRHAHGRRAGGHRGRPRARRHRARRGHRCGGRRGVRGRGTDRLAGDALPARHRSPRARTRGEGGTWQGVRAGRRSAS